ncbi:MAG: SDR family NAD(P)-dependent oxidoreductase [Candidatus Lokiarchaeota archaeon]|nr:SDR family NAD(P)-dependent oxidoreductase [Candidatus Lokiarchaeota archaeon]
MRLNKFYKGKSAVITGAGSGIGKSFAMQLANKGTNLVISDINVERVNNLKDELSNREVSIISSYCDASNPSDLSKLADLCFEELSSIDFLFNNAGIAVGGQFDLLSLEKWRSIIDLNVWGMIHCVRAFLPMMLSQGFGHIIVTSSIAGVLGVGGLSPYSTTKFANAGFCEALYSEYRKKGIDVSIISPFPIKTNLIEDAKFDLPPHIEQKMNGIDSEKAINTARAYYWNEFCKMGMECDKAVKKYLKKIKKKKLYIFEKRMGRIVQFIKGAYSNLYKKILVKIGDQHLQLFEEAYEEALKVAKENE